HERGEQLQCCFGLAGHVPSSGLECGFVQERLRLQRAARACLIDWIPRGRGLQRPGGTDAAPVTFALLSIARSDLCRQTRRGIRPGARWVTMPPGTRLRSRAADSILPATEGPTRSGPVTSDGATRNGRRDPQGQKRATRAVDGTCAARGP